MPSRQGRPRRLGLNPFTHVSTILAVTEPLTDKEYDALLRAVCSYATTIENQMAERPIHLDLGRYEPIDNLWLARLVDLRTAWSKVSDTYWNTEDQP